MTDKQISPVSVSDVENQFSKCEALWGNVYKSPVREDAIQLVYKECDDKNISLSTLEEATDRAIQDQLKGSSSSYKPKAIAIIANLTSNYSMSVREAVWDRADWCGECNDGIRRMNTYKGGRFYQTSVFFCHCGKATSHPKYSEYGMARYADVEKWALHDDNIVIVTEENELQEYKNRMNNCWPINGVEPQETFEEIPF